MPVLLLVPAVTSAADRMPGEERAGIIYALTHLPSVTYLILFAIFVLSVINLVYRGWLRPDQLPLFATGSLRGRGSRRTGRKGRPRKAKGCGADGSTDPGTMSSTIEETWQKIGDEPFQEGVLDAPRAVKKIDKTAWNQPTPLDGVNHPLPPSLSGGNSQAGPARPLPGKSDLTATKTRFKFTSAVELPSQEEVERRDKQKLVVTGIVKGIDGKGIGAVLVYLTDERGNRIGQSCRSVADTGEFKVLVNEPGKYVLVGYKRGLIMEDADPAKLPIESGKIEGYTLHMIPEGCLVHGRVIFEEYSQPQQDLEIRCIRPEDGFTRSAAVESAGAFRITGAPHDSMCHLEVFNREGEMIASTDSFQTGREREVFRNVTVSATQIVEVYEETPPPPEEPLVEEAAAEDPPPPVAATPVDQA